MSEQLQSGLDAIAPPISPLAEMILVIKGQHETLFDNGFWDIWCLETDQHCEVSNGPKESIEEFAARLLRLGWAVDSVEFSTAICYDCINYESPVSEREAWEDEKVYEMRKD